MKSYLAALFLFSHAALALAQVEVREPWIRATVAQQRATGAFLKITAAHPLRLVEAHTPAAAKVEFHEMKMEKDLMQMRSVPVIDLPARQTINFSPGGIHLMLLGLKSAVSPGQTIPLTLVLEDQGKKRETVELNVPVRPLSYSGSTGHAGH